jgi:hypothetical protein
MSVHDDKTAGREEDQRTTDKDSDRKDDRRPTEKPEPDEEDKKKAAEMMTAYEDRRPTVVLPGSGGMVSGTAVNDWLDDDGNPKFGAPDDAGDGEAHKEQIEKDKALNEELKQVSTAENKDEKR